MLEQRIDILENIVGDGGFCTKGMDMGIRIKYLEGLLGWKSYDIGTEQRIENLEKMVGIDWAKGTIK